MIGAACIAWSAPALAQKLDLDKPAAPLPAKSALALADTLDKEAQVLLRPRAGDDVPASSRARAALRTLGAAWIREGDKDAAAGAARLLAGRTIALRRHDLDDVIGPDDAVPARMFMVAALAHDLEHHDELAGQGEIDRFLRDALWPLLSDADGAACGWVPGPAARGAPTRPLHELAALTDLGPEDLLAVQALEHRLDRAGAVPAYRASADDLRAGAAVALDTLSHGRAKLLAPAVRDALRKEFLAAIADAGDAPAVRADRLRRLSLLCDALALVSAMDTSNAGVRILRTALESLATSGAWRDDATFEPRLRLVSRTIERSTPDTGVTDDKTLPRQFRPAMRALEPLARQSGLQTLEVIARVLADADATADPAVLGALTAHARRMTDVRLLRVAADAIAEPGKSGEPEVPAPHRFLAERFLALGQDLARPDKRDLAISEVRDLSAQARDWKTLAGEKDLRDGMDDPAWEAITGAKTKELVALIDSTRTAWIGAWTSPRALPPVAVTRRLATLRDALPLLASCAGLHALASGDSRLQAWPGWELSEPAAKWLGAGIDDAAKGLCAGVISGAEDATTGPRKQLAGELSLAVTVGRLERRARAVGVNTLPDPEQDALAQLVFGPPPLGAWLADAREDAAMMCRCIEEAAAAAGDRARKEETARFKAAAERAARNVAARLDAEGQSDR